MEEKVLIKFRNIVKEFDGTIVLKGINLDIYEVMAWQNWNYSIYRNILAR